MGIATEQTGNAAPFLCGAPRRLPLHNFHSLGSNREQRIEGTERVLRDEGDASSADLALDLPGRHCEQILAGKADRSSLAPRIAGQNAENRIGEGGLAAAG